MMKTALLWRSTLYKFAQALLKPETVEQCANHKSNDNPFTLEDGVWGQIVLLASLLRSEDDIILRDFDIDW